MKYFIHACPKRLWYVENFLIPSMVEQGINREDISVWNDEKEEGNLVSWLKSCNHIQETMSEEKGIWHLQDDIVIGKSFREETEKAGDMIINTWVCKRFNATHYTATGVVGVLYHWNSFQCVYIPNRYLFGFLKWYYKTAVKDEYCLKRIQENRWDDWLFWTYMRRMNRGDRCLNLAPNICEHIDYMIGGSVATPEREGNVYGVYWEENEILEELWKKIKEFKAEEAAKAETQNKTPKRPRKATQGGEPRKRSTTGKKPVKTQNKKGEQE